VRNVALVIPFHWVDFAVPPQFILAYEVLALPLVTDFSFVPAFDRKKLALDLSDLLVRAVLQINESVAGRLHAAQQFVELEMKCASITVLRVLHQKDHQEGNDGRPGVDDQLPSIGIAEDRSGHDPEKHNSAGGGEGRRRTQEARGLPGDVGKRIGRFACV